MHQGGEVTLPGRKVTRTWFRNRPRLLVAQAESTQRSTQPTPEQHLWFRYTSLSARSHRRAHSPRRRRIAVVAQQRAAALPRTCVGSAAPAAAGHGITSLSSSAAGSSLAALVCGSCGAVLHAYQAVREDQVRPPGVLLPWLLQLLLQPGSSTPCKLHARASMHARMPAAAGEDYLA